MDKLLYDINEVCRMLGTTSRTLRFYEAKGIITSSKCDYSSRRQYTKEQINEIKNVLILRSLGLSVKGIAELKNDESDLKNAILSRKAEIFAQIETKVKEIELLTEALNAIDSGENIFDKSFNESLQSPTAEIEECVLKCSKAFVNGDDEIIYLHFSDKMKAALPLSAYKSIRQSTLQPLGKFIDYRSISVDNNNPNIVLHYLEFEKIGLIIKYVIHDQTITGLWFSNYELKKIRS